MNKYPTIFGEADRIEFAPHLDIWMRGNRYGTVLAVQDDGLLYVLPDTGLAITVSPAEVRLVRKAGWS